MAPYIYGSRNDIHIIDLTQTVPLLHQALVALRDVAAGGGRILFVGTKRQASEPVAAAAKRCAQYYVNHRWLGGTLTNWQTISQLDPAPAQHRRDADSAPELGPDQEGTARPAARARQAGAFARRHQGNGRPAQHAVRDRHEQGSDRDRRSQASWASRSPRSSIPTAIRTASPIRFPGNDDAARALALYCDLVARAIIDGSRPEPGRSRHRCRRGGRDLPDAASHAEAEACRRSTPTRA